MLQIACVANGIESDFLADGGVCMGYLETPLIVVTYSSSWGRYLGIRTGHCAITHVASHLFLERATVQK